MTKRQFHVALAVLSVSGMMGGALVSWLMPGRVAYAQEARTIASEVRAERFVVVDKSGATKAEFGTIVGSPHITLYNEAGDMSIRLVSVPLGAPRLIFFGSEDRRIELGYATEEGPVLRFFEGEEDIRMLLYMINGEPTLTFKDEAGQHRMILGRPWIVPKEEGNVNSIMLLDETGDVQWQAP